MVLIIKLVISESKDKIQKQIEDLEYKLSKKKRENDKYIYIEAIKILQETLETLETLEEIENEPSPAGRKKVIAFESIQRLKEKGYTQEQAARELNVSISTVRRNWK